MANDSAAATEPKFKDIRIGLGEEWDFERDGPLTGNYIGTAVQELDDKQNKGRKREQNVYQFAPTDNPDEVVFIWGSDQLDRAFASEDIQIGSLMRITYLGREQFTADDGTPRQVKRYRVQVAE